MPDLSLLESCVRAFGRVQLRVTGGCMGPVLPAGARVGLECAERRPARLGDIVLVRTKHGLRLHRVVWKLPFGDGAMRTKGDRATGWDPPVAPGDVLGVVASSDAAADPASRRLWWTFRSLAVLLWARVRRAFVRGGR